MRLCRQAPNSVRRSLELHRRVPGQHCVTSHVGHEKARAAVCEQLSFCLLVRLRGFEPLPGLPWVVCKRLSALRQFFGVCCVSCARLWFRRLNLPHLLTCMPNAEACNGRTTPAGDSTCLQLSVTALCAHVAVGFHCVCRPGGLSQCNAYGIECNDAGNVVALKLQKNNLNCRFVDVTSLQAMTYLEHLNIGENNLYGPLPAWFSKFSNLQVLIPGQSLSLLLRKHNNVCPLLRLSYRVLLPVVVLLISFRCVCCLSGVTIRLKPFDSPEDEKSIILEYGLK